MTMCMIKFRSKASIILTASEKCPGGRLGEPGGHLAALVLVEKLRNGGADRVLLQSSRKALGVDADGKGGHACKTAIVLHTLRGALPIHGQIFKTTPDNSITSEHQSGSQQTGSGERKRALQSRFVLWMRGASSIVKASDSPLLLDLIGRNHGEEWI